MNRKHPLIPKGKACRLDLTPEYEEGKNSNCEDTNPYDFWDEYTKNYAWCIGRQQRGR